MVLLLAACRLVHRLAIANQLSYVYIQPWPPKISSSVTMNEANPMMLIMQVSQKVNIPGITIPKFYSTQHWPPKVPGHSRKLFPAVIRNLST